MFNHCGFEAENVRESVITNLLKKFVMRVSADEGDEGGNGTPSNTDTNPRFDFEQMIAMARKEEKDKLYPRIKKLEEENKTLTANNNANLLEVARVKLELEKAEANKDESKVVADLKKEIVELEATILQLKESTPNEEELEAKFKAQLEVEKHKLQVLADNKDNILSVFADEIGGNTVEEIDTSLQKVIDKTIETKKSLGLLDENGKPITKPSKKDTTPPVVNPSGAKDEEYDLDYVRSLDPRSKEYAEWRRKQGLK